MSKATAQVPGPVTQRVREATTNLNAAARNLIENPTCKVAMAWQDAAVQEAERAHAVYAEWKTTGGEK